MVRNPCYHPGDVRVLKLVKSNPRYAYLSDCVVFPVRGHRPHADESSGGDLDGDKFFVSWDVNLIPRWPSKPFDYSPVNYVDMIAGLISDKVGRSALALKLAAQRLAQDHLPSVFGRPEEAEKRHKLQERQSQLAYFATYSNDLVCRVDAIFMKYAGRFGPSCQECVFLNGFFSAAVDMVAHRDAVLKDLRRLERHFHQHPSPERRAVEEKFRQFLAYMEWSKPVFRPGDDVWTTMQQQATEFVDQMGRMHPSQQGRR